ncbi:MAG: hypothetical protein ACK4P1_09540 [Aggregatilineales bacterium]
MRKALYALIVLACLVPSALIVFATQPFGMGISSDGMTYLLVSESIARGEGALTAYVAWAPFYPFLIAFVHKLLQVDLLTAALLINAALLWAIMVLTTITISKLTRNLAITALSAVALATFPPVFRVSLWAMSETPFIALSICLFVAMDAYIEQPRFTRLIIAALLTALLCLTRYTGMAVVGITALFLLIFHWRRHDSLGLIISRIAIYSLVALLPLAIWAVRNIALSGTPFGIRAPALETVGGSLARIIVVFVVWSFSLTPLSIILIPIIAAVILLLRRYWRAVWRSICCHPTLRLYVGLFALLYTLFMFISSITTYFDALDERLLSPVAIPFFIFILSMSQALFTFARTARDRLSGTLLVFFSAWIILNWGSLYFATNHMRAEGVGYLSRQWRENQLISFLRQSDILRDCVVYSNEGYIVYLNTGYFSHFTLIKTYYPSLGYVNKLDDSWLASEEGCVVWINDVKYSFIYTLEELKTTADFTPILELESGSVYRVRKRAAP